jgi:hypothetical protein
MSDPRSTDPRLRDSMTERYGAGVGKWGWIVGSIFVVIAFIAFIAIVGSNQNHNTANNNLSPVTTGSAPHNLSPPSTTGSGSSSPQPLKPVPNRNDTQ